MKKEGRQNGSSSTKTSSLVSPTPMNPKISSSSSSKGFNQFDSRPESRAQPSTGLSTKMSPPTKKSKNHWSFPPVPKTRWTACHVVPTARSKDKIKGTQKLKSMDVAMNHKLAAWRVDCKGQGLNYKGISATSILSQLSSNGSLGLDDVDDHVYYDDDHHVDGLHDDDVYDHDDGDDYHHGHHVGNVVYDIDDGEAWPVLAVHVVKRDDGFCGGSGGSEEDLDDDEDEDEDDDHMSFCDVGFVIDDGDGGDEDWCLVGEL